MNSALIQITETPAQVKLLARMITIDKDIVVIGNSIESDLVLIDDEVESSQQFISITPNQDESSFTFKALTNLVRLNDNEVLELAPIKLNDGDIIQVNGYTLLFSWDGQLNENIAPMANTLDQAIDNSTSDDVIGFDVNNIISGIEQGDESIISSYEAENEAPDYEYQSHNILSSEEGMNSKQLTVIADKLDKLVETCNNPWVQQKELFLIIDKVIEKFMNEFSPEYIEDMIGKPSVLPSKHWNVYKKYFSKKQENGQFSRQFKALLIECLQEK